MRLNSTTHSFMTRDHIHISLKFLTRHQTEFRMLLAVLLHPRNPQENMNKTAYDSQRESPLRGFNSRHCRKIKER